MKYEKAIEVVIRCTTYMLIDYEVALDSLSDLSGEQANRLKRGINELREAIAVLKETPKSVF